MPGVSVEPGSETLLAALGRTAFPSYMTDVTPPGASPLRIWRVNAASPNSIRLREYHDGAALTEAPDLAASRSDSDVLLARDLVRDRRVHSHLPAVELPQARPGLGIER